MSQIPVPRCVLRLMMAGAFVLMVAICVIWAVSLLLGQMGDPAGQRALNYVALAAGVVLVIDLISLVLAQTLNATTEPDDEEINGEE